MFPELVPGIIGGIVIGVGYGLYTDFKRDEFGHWWQYGCAGLVIGAVAWFVLLAVS
jgi:hypothetical protein